MQLIPDLAFYTRSAFVRGVLYLKQDLSFKPMNMPTRFQPISAISHRSAARSRADYQFRRNAVRRRR